MRAANCSSGSRPQRVLLRHPRCPGCPFDPTAALALTHPTSSLWQVTGPTLTLAGFPSWLVRSSEIYEAGPLARLAAEPLEAAMQRYCRTKQRFGK